MSNRLLGATGRVLFWTYQRGTWQYDILCAIILAFIFLTPKSVFRGVPFIAQEKPKIEEEDKTKGDDRASYHLRQGKFREPR
jgi:hypothetical protein